MYPDVLARCISTPAIDNPLIIGNEYILQTASLTLDENGNGFMDVLSPQGKWIGRFALVHFTTFNVIPF